MPLKKVLITGISGIVGSSVYLRMRPYPERYELYGFGRRRALSDRVKDDREIEPLPPGVPRVSDAMPAEPRNLYASTKVFAESLCRTYAHGHGMSCLAVRIGWVVAEDRPPNRRGMDVWCSQRDIGDLFRACVDAPAEVRFAVLYGMSNNRTCWVDLENARQLLGFTPQDRAEDWLDQTPD